MSGWQSLAIRVLAPVLVSFVGRFFGAFFEWARGHFDGEELEGATNPVESRLSADELRVVRDLLDALEDRATVHAVEFVRSGGEIPDFDRSTE